MDQGVMNHHAGRRTEPLLHFPPLGKANQKFM